MSDTERVSDDHKKDEAIYLPRTVIDRIVQDTLPENMLCAKDTKNLLLECSTEFIAMLATHANDLCEKEAKKMMAPEHILQALEELGFADYVADVEQKYSEAKASARPHRRKNKKTDKEKDTEEMRRQQQQLFEEAKRAGEEK